MSLDVMEGVYKTAITMLVTLGLVIVAALASEGLGWAAQISKSKTLREFHAGISEAVWIVLSKIRSEAGDVPDVRMAEARSSAFVLVYGSMNDRRRAKVARALGVNSAKFSTTLEEKISREFDCQHRKLTTGEGADHG